MSQERDYGKEQLFIKLLRKRGYPSSSIRVERNEGGIRFDVGVYSISGTLIQVFEIKNFSHHEEAKKVKLWERLYTQFELDELYPEIYIVSYEDNNFKIMEVVDGVAVNHNEATTDLDSVLDYKYALGRYAKRIAKEPQKPNKKLKYIKVYSWVVVGLLLFSIIASYCCCVCYSLSFELLGFLGLIYILLIFPIIFPSIKTVKIGSIEIELISKELMNLINRDNDLEVK